jgi:hypothetical protein
VHTERDIISRHSDIYSYSYSCQCKSTELETWQWWQSGSHSWQKAFCFVSFVTFVAISEITTDSCKLHGFASNMSYEFMVCQNVGSGHQRGCVLLWGGRRILNNYLKHSCIEHIAGMPVRHVAATGEHIANIFLDSIEILCTLLYVQRRPRAVWICGSPWRLLGSCNNVQNYTFRWPAGMKCRVNVMYHYAGRGVTKCEHPRLNQYNQKNSIEWHTRRWCNLELLFLV